MVHASNNMKAILWTISVILLITFADAAVQNHSCLPTGYSAICRLEFVFYDGNSTQTHVFPNNYSHIHIGTEGWSKGIHSVIKIFNPALHAEFGYPRAVEIVNAYMSTLVIPAKLYYGNFADNSLFSFSVEQTDSDPLLTFLDLGSNSLTDITRISGLINLETLYLAGNRLEVLQLNLLQKLTKLKVLNLHYNNIHQLSGESFPTSLTYLGLYGNDMRVLNYSVLSLPALQMLNIERNHLTTIDAAALILAMPNVKTISIGGNDFSFDKIKPTLDIFAQHNITYMTASDEISCRYDDQKVEGVCLKRGKAGSAWRMSWLSILTVLVAAVFVFIVRWVFIAMNK